MRRPGIHFQALFGSALLAFCSGQATFAEIQKAPNSATAQRFQRPAPETAAGQRFELSAMYNQKPTLSRAEIDPAAVEVGPQPAPGSLPRIEAPKPAPALAGKPLKVDLADRDDGTGYLQEYNVDWSHWITAQADRWFYTLKTSEAMFGLQFVTVRPAMIQFTCYADGSIGNLVLKQSSGAPLYDRLQMETLLATMPTMPFPKGTRRASITLCQGWESHPKQPGEDDFQPGTFGKDFPKERVRQWAAGR